MLLALEDIITVSRDIKTRVERDTEALGIPGDDGVSTVSLGPTFRFSRSMTILSDHLMPMPK